MKTKISSPSRSQGAHTPRRKSRRTLSVGSPALSTASGRLTSVVQGFVNKQINSFALSPLPKRRSVLTDNTDIMEEPRRQSWWKKLNENSRNVLDILEDNNLAEPNNIMEELDIEILSQEKKNYTLDIPESSDGESIHSIVLPQRKLFTQKENQHQKKFDQIIGTRETMTKSNKNMTINDKVVNAGTKELFQNKPRSKLLFPAALLDISLDKTIADKTKEFAAEPKTQPRKIFGNRQVAKRKNMFADFIATESEDELPEIQPRVFGFPKKPELIRRGSSASRGIRESSPTSNVTTDTEMDEWRLLPSSTMVDHQLEAMMEQNTPKRPRLSKLTETKESSGTNTVFSKTKSPEVNTSVLTRSRLRALNNSGTSTTGGKNKTHEKIDKNQSKKNNQHDKSQNNKSRDKIKESNKNLENNEDQNLNIADISQGKMNKSKGKHNKSLQKTNVISQKTNANLVIGNEQDGDQSQEIVDGMVNVALEANRSESQIDEEQAQQNEVDVNVENNKQKVVAESQEVDESEEVNVSQDIDDNKEEPEESEQEEAENQEDESENEGNEIQKVGEESDKEEVAESQEEQDNENEGEANEIQEHLDESMEQEVEGQAADQSRAEVDEINESINLSQIDENDEENDEEINEENDEEIDEEIKTADKINKSNEAADESNEIADQSQEEVDESNQTADESHEATQEEVDKSNVEENERQLATEDDENKADKNIQEEVDESNVEQNESQEDDENESVEDENEVQNESQLAVEDDENEASEHDESTQEEVDESTQEEVDESNIDQNESQEDDENEAVEDENQNEDGSENAELHYESASEEMEADDEPQIDEDDTPIDQENIANTPEPADNEYNLSHDTTGRNRNKHTSPEAILHDETKQTDSFSARRNTSIRKTKSVVNLLNDKPSLIPARDSVGFSDGTTNSSAEGSGWDSHRTTRKTIRQTFGKDATPRKSLRALVMEKSAKRHTLASETAKFPLANSTAVPEISLGYLDIQPVHQESTHEVSLRTRQLTLDAVLEKIKKDNLKKKAEIEESVKKSLETRSDDHIFKVPLRPMFPRRQPNRENKTSKVKPMWRGLPDEMIEDLQYKPPKRFKPSNAPWITKRLYKYLETKLEPKYDYKARVRAEKLVETVYNFTKDLRRQPAASEDATNVLKHEMARLQIVRTHHEFYEFFRQFMPKEIRIKVIPDVVNKIPLPRRDVFSDIIVTDSAQG